MSDTITRTQNGSLFDTWTGEHEDNDGEDVLRPRFRLLYHVDLDRIGALSLPSHALKTGAWVAIGRRGPVFVEPRADGLERPLEDPTISRRQLMVRWVAEAGCFEVESVEEARRPVGVLELEGERGEDEGVRVTPIKGRVRLAPGTCVAIEDRVLLGLEVTSEPFKGPDAERFGLVGESASMWQLRRDIVEVAEFGHPALLLGPTGAGKELVAHAIHEQSARGAESFVTVNCAALPEHLVESLLFGHKKGAFTGADSNAPGRFRAAHKGTLFLDELGEMPLHVQPKLLRAVQDGKIAPVGQHGTVEVDVRLVAATNREPTEEIAAHRLREDLFHRLSAHILRLPALGERRFDIPELFVHFMRGLRDEHPRLSWMWEGPRKWRRTVPMSFFIDLMTTSWSGNVRELQNVTVRTARRNLTSGAFHAPTGSLVRTSMDNLKALARPQVRGEPEVPTGGASADEHDVEELGKASEVLELAHKTVAKLVPAPMLSSLIADAETEEQLAALLVEVASAHLLSLLATHGFRQRAVASDLDVSPSTLIKLMQQFGIPRPSDLSLAAIEEAIEAAGGDVDKAAQRLKVSPQGLRKRLTLLRLKT